MSCPLGDAARVAALLSAGAELLSPAFTLLGCFLIAASFLTHWRVQLLPDIASFGGLPRLSLISLVLPTQTLFHQSF